MGDRCEYKKIVFNDKLGYAIVYYDPVESVRSEDICEHRKQQVFKCRENESNFYEEVQAMVRRREREDAEKEIRKICEKVNDLFLQVEQADLSRREFLSHSVRQQIKGKSADEICKILVDDVLVHAKCIPRPKENITHKERSKLLPAPVTQASKEHEVRSHTPATQRERNSLRPDVFQRVEATLNKSLEAEIHSLKLKRILDKIQNDIVVLKRRCTEKIDFNY